MHKWKTKIQENNENENPKQETTKNWKQKNQKMKNKKQKPKLKKLKNIKQIGYAIILCRRVNVTDGAVEQTECGFALLLL